MRDRGNLEELCGIDVTKLPESGFRCLALGWDQGSFAAASLIDGPLP